MSQVIQNVIRGASDTIVHLCGEIDLHQAPEFHERLVELCHENPQRLILVLSQVQYIDSSGVGSLVEIFRRLRKQDRKLILVAPSERVRSVLEITRLDRFFTIVATEDEAKTQ